MKFFIPAALMVALPVSAMAQTDLLTAAQRAEGEAMVRKAAEKLADSLKDPSSARFRNVFVRKTLGKDGQEHVSLCGQVNSRNGFGGMSGFHSFMLIGGQVRVGGAGQIINADEICNNGLGQFDSRDYAPELRKAFDGHSGV